MRKLLLVLFLFSSLKAFETAGAIWPDGMVGIQPQMWGGWNGAVYNAIIGWEDKRYWLGPADIIFTTGERVIVKWASLGADPALAKIYLKISSCRNLQEIIYIYINSDYYSMFTLDSPPGNKYYFPTTVRHEIGHSVGLADVYESQTPLPIMFINR